MRIITDSAADFTPDELERYRIPAVYADGMSLCCILLYANMYEANTPVNRNLRRRV